MSEFSELKIDGRVATPQDDDWDAARLTWNLTADAQPEAVAFVEGADDIAAVLGFAAANDLTVIGQGTGHGAVPVGDFAGTIVIKTERMRGISIDADSGTARIEAGVLAAEVGAAAYEAGMCSLPGLVARRGRDRLHTRRRGRLARAQLRLRLQPARRRSRWSPPTASSAASTPTASPSCSGRCAAAAAASPSSTAIEARLVPPHEVFGGTIIYPAQLGVDALRAYRDWAAASPDEISSIIRFLRPPPLPDVPEPLRDTPLLTFGAVAIGDLDAGERAIAPMRELGEPIMDGFTRMPTNAISHIHMDPEQPVPGVGHSKLIRELPDEALEAFFGQVGPDAGSPLLLAEFVQLGGALGRPDTDGGALTHLDAEYLMFATGVAMSPEMAAAASSSLDRLDEALSPWAADGAFLNFADRPADLESIFDSETAARLASVKREWDPDGLIRANHAPARAG